MPGKRRGTAPSGAVRALVVGAPGDSNLEGRGELPAPAGKLPKIPEGTLSGTYTPERIPVDQQPVRTIPGGMRVATDPLTGEIMRDPRDIDPNDPQRMQVVTPRDRLRMLLQQLLGLR